MSGMKDCIFCKIISGEVQTSSKIYEDENVFVFLSNGPVNPGHALVLPKEHIANIYEGSDKTLSYIGPALKKTAIAVKKATAAQGVNIISNNDRPAGQAVFHLHFHVIPRFVDDGLVNWEHKRDYKKGEIEEYAEKIRAALS
jgi:histidine triad (HIT) family protein